MIERAGDMFGYLREADIVCVLINQTTYGHPPRLIMGGGQALRAARCWPGLDLQFGELVDKGELLPAVTREPLLVVGFPTKVAPELDSDLKLIRRAAEQLVRRLDNSLGGHSARVFIPRPGVGLGGLHWSDVKPVIEPLFDQRFTVWRLEK